MFVEKRAGKLSNLRTALLDGTPQPSSAWPTRAGRPTADPTTSTRIPTRTARARSRSSTTASSRTSRSCATACVARGHELASETDTEALAHLVEEAYDGDIADAVRGALRQARRRVRGRGACTRASPTGWSARAMNVPLIVGIGEGENFLASDVAAVLGPHQPVIFLEEGDVADIARQGVTVTGVDGSPRERPVTEIDWSIEAAEKGGFEHFMLKEMHEQPAALLAAITGRVHERRRSSWTSSSR